MAVDIAPAPSDVRQVIQLAITPVFLLTAVGTTLNVLTNRLARIVDRGRLLEDRFATRGAQPISLELALLERRAKVVYIAITLAVISALFVSLLIAAAFAAYLLNLVLSWSMAALFVSAMVSYTGALVCLLFEVFLGVRSFRLGITSSPASDGAGPGR